MEDRIVLRGLRRRLSYANVMATIAVFVALGGSSYAALTVTGKNVKNSSLTGKDVKNNSLTGSDVKGLKSGDIADRSLLSQDFKAGQLPAGAAGPRGPSDAFVADESDTLFTTVNTTRTVLGTLNLPAGKYVIFAKATLNNNGATVASWDCDLTAGTDSDATGGGALPVGTQDDREILTLSVSHEFTSAGSASLGCSSTLAGNAGMVVINAIQVANLSKTAFESP
jgi:hypothetical protein